MLSDSSEAIGAFSFADPPNFFKTHSHFFADADNALCFIDQALKQLFIFAFRDKNSDLVGLHEAQLMQAQAANDAELFVQVTASMQISAKARSNKGEAAEPVDLFRQEFVSFKDNLDFDLASVLVFEQFLYPIVEFQSGATGGSAGRSRGE